MDNISNAFGPYVAQQLSDKVVCNVGTLTGDFESVKGLCITLYLMGVGHYIPNDQAAFNVLVHLGLLNKNVQIAEQSDAWACQCGVLMAEDRKHLRPYVIGTIPTFSDGKVRNFSGMPFVMVHQYDRVPELNDFFQGKYGYE
jgi:hypothetical protein